MTTVACVLRSGGDFKPEHVERLQASVARHLPGARFACLSDVDVPCERIPLRYGWPGWWAKMELFRPDIEGGLLYFDLDTLIIGDLSDMAAVTGPVIMRDVYRPHGWQSSVMHITQDVKTELWHTWMRGPEKWMTRYRRGGDQQFIEQHSPAQWRLWQDICPGQLASYKVHVRAKAVPAGARAIVFHGKPRPWSTPLWTQAA